MNVVLGCCLCIDSARIARLIELFDGFQSKVRMNRFGTVGSEYRHVMCLQSASGFDDKTGIGAKAGCN